MLVFVLCVYKVVVVLIVIYVVVLWGVGFSGGYVFGFDVGGIIFVWLIGVCGFWFVNMVSLMLVGVGFVLYLCCIGCVYVIVVVWCVVCYVFFSMLVVWYDECMSGLVMIFLKLSVSVLLCYVVNVFGFM